jgi:hypothetical protein
LVFFEKNQLNTILRHASFRTAIEKTENKISSVQVRLLLR